MTDPVAGPGTRVGRALSVASALVAFLGLTPAVARAQRPSSEGVVRVVEFVDPATGARSRQAVYDLTKKEIQAVQRALRRAGYLGVGWTGQLDHGTVKALGEFQDDRGLYRCDCVSYETIVALGLKPAVEVTTVAVGGAGQPGQDPYAGYGAGYYYPIGVPVLVPGNPEPPGHPAHLNDSTHPGHPDGPDHREPHPGEGEATVPARPYPPPGATPPGIRPLPPPRVMPADGRSGGVPPPAP